MMKFSSEEDFKKLKTTIMLGNMSVHKGTNKGITILKDHQRLKHRRKY